MWTSLTVFGLEGGKNGVRFHGGCQRYLGAKVIQTLDLGTHIAVCSGCDGDGGYRPGAIGYLRILSCPYQATARGRALRVRRQREGRMNSERTQNPAGKRPFGGVKSAGTKYVGEELPEDYICPICKHPASDFKKVVSRSCTWMKGSGIIKPYLVAKGGCYMDARLEPLFTPWRIRNCEIKNRIVLTSMGGTDLFGWMEKTILTRMGAFIMEVAKNNAGLVLPGCQPVYNPMFSQWLHKNKK